MARYITRRILQMIPTVFGVILITFVLFNVVGGSPATMTLGKHVSPRALEEFDEQRGFNKPLFFGWWAKTRALDDQSYERNIGAWRKVVGAEFVENTGLRLTRDATVPLAFPLQATHDYRLTITYRLAAGAAFFQGSEKENIEISKAWKTVALDFRTGVKPATTDLVFRVTGGALEIRAAKLQRGVAQPFDAQLVFYLKQLLRLDFGTSSSLNQPVAAVLRQGVGPSVMLMLPILIGEELFAIVLALGCAFYRNSWLDRSLVILAVALMSVNYLVWIVGGQYVLGYRRGWFPMWGFESWSYLLLPILIGVISGLGANLRFYRAIMLDEMYKDYIRTAVAKGVSKTGVLFKHVLKNAMIPVATNVVVALPFLYTGNFLLESFFGIPGLGYLGINAINSSDVDVMRALVFMGAVLFVVANLVTDLLYAWLDPRVRLE
ncbi:MAG: ABC transporter permease [Verrucomicrobia bacterium]|nr:MAG: ABC transporter permease [Verrucomicrobiota bacterium]